MEANIYKNSGGEAGKVNLPDEMFNLPWNGDLVHQVVVSAMANKRGGYAAHTKDRSEVSGTGKKPWRQKGTGRARHGSRRSPIWRTGGVTHGPRNSKDYSKKINKKMKQKALFTILSKKLKDGQLVFVDDLPAKEAKTKSALTMLQNVAKSAGKEEITTRRNNAACVLVPGRTPEQYMSFRNLPSIHFEDLKNASILDMLNYKYVVIAKPEEALAFFGGDK